VEALARKVHLDLAAHLEFARIWGKTAGFEAQQVDRHHPLEDRDAAELHA
jgi:ribosome-interacting GTPase 1